eukprot:Clim_evm29s152 gene=Clim_evmTU29s152
MADDDFSFEDVIFGSNSGRNGQNGGQKGYNWRAPNVPEVAVDEERDTLEDDIASLRPNFGTMSSGPGRRVRHASTTVMEDGGHERAAGLLGTDVKKDRRRSGMDYMKGRSRDSSYDRHRSRESSRERRHNRRVSNDPNQRSEHVILVTNVKGVSKNDLVEFTERKCGKLRMASLLEGQDFGFLQFLNDESVARALKDLHGAEFLGKRVSAERVPHITPGVDPRKSVSSDYAKNNAIVIKNLPFNMTESEVHDVLNSTEGAPRARDIQLHYDNSHQFRGMVFVVYDSIEDAEKAYTAISGLDVGGRAVRCEYKKTNALRQSSLANISLSANDDYEPPDDECRKIWLQLQKFAQGPSHHLDFPSFLSAEQRRQIHIMAIKLGLNHQSQGEGDERFIMVWKPDSSHDGGLSVSAGARDIPGRSRSTDGGHRNNNRLSANVKGSTDYLSTSPKGGRSRTGSETHSPVGSWRNNMLMNEPRIQPVRQPIGPDGSIGFRIRRSGF